MRASRRLDPTLLSLAVLLLTPLPVLPQDDLYEKSLSSIEEIRALHELLDPVDQERS